MQNTRMLLLKSSGCFGCGKYDFREDGIYLIDY